MRASVLNLLHPFQTFILRTKNFSNKKVAAKHKIPLIFYGDNTAEGNPIAENNTSIRSKLYHTTSNLDQVYLGGIKYNDLIKKYKIDPEMLSDFIPLSLDIFNKTQIEVRHLSYYLKWVPQEHTTML